MTTAQAIAILELFPPDSRIFGTTHIKIRPALPFTKLRDVSRILGIPETCSVPN